MKQEFSTNANQPWMQQEDDAHWDRLLRKPSKLNENLKTSLLERQFLLEHTFGFASCDTFAFHNAQTCHYLEKEEQLLQTKMIKIRIFAK